MAQRSVVGNLIQGLTSLDGRMSRTEFWVASFALLIAAALLSIALTTFVRIGLQSWPRWALPLLLQVLILWPLFAVMVKRGHDRERSALWTLGVNIFGHVVPQILLVTGRTEGAFYVWATIGVYILFDYGLLDGTAGANKFGASPKGVGQANIAA